MEDNLYLAKGVLVKSNEESVAKMRHLIEELSLEVASPDETREMLNLKVFRKCGLPPKPFFPAYFPASLGREAFHLLPVLCIGLFG
jgi:hypothetical protein